MGSDQAAPLGTTKATRRTRAVDDLGEQGAHLVDVGWGRGRSARRGRQWSGLPAGDQQRVVRHFADRGESLARVASTLEGPEREGGTGRRGKRGQLEVPSLTEHERLSDRERLVPEVRLRPDELNADALLGQRAKGQSGLERGHAVRRR